MFIYDVWFPNLSFFFSHNIGSFFTKRHILIALLGNFPHFQINSWLPPLDFKNYFERKGIFYISLYRKNYFFELAKRIITHWDFHQILALHVNYLFFFESSSPLDGYYTFSIIENDLFTWRREEPVISQISWLSETDKWTVNSTDFQFIQDVAANGANIPRTGNLKIFV